MMIENNKGEVYDDIIPMIVYGIHDTDCDGDYESFHLILKSISLDPDRFEFDNDRELAYSNCFEGYNWINVNQSSNIISPLFLPQKQVH